MDIKKEDIGKINGLLKEEFKKDKALLSVSISTIDGLPITYMSERDTLLNPDVIASYICSAINSSMLILKETLNTVHNFNFIIGKDTIIITLYRGSVLIHAVFASSSQNFDEIHQRLQKFDDLSVEINKTMKVRDIISIITNSIPKVTWVDVITKVGFSTKSDTHLKDFSLSGQIAHLFEVAEMMLKTSIDTFIMAGIGGFILLYELDDNRILSIGIADNIDEEVFFFQTKFKKIIELSS